MASLAITMVASTPGAWAVASASALKIASARRGLSRGSSLWGKRLSSQRYSLQAVPLGRRHHSSQANVTRATYSFSQNPPPQKLQDDVPLGSADPKLGPAAGPKATSTSSTSATTTASSSSSSPPGQAQVPGPPSISPTPGYLDELPPPPDEGRFRRNLPNVSYWRNFSFESEKLPTPAEVAAKLASEDWATRQYWAAQVGRSAFFMSQMAALSAAAFNSRGYQWENAAKNCLAMYRQDLDNIKRGYYRMPWDMSPLHRQANPLWVAGSLLRFVETGSRSLSMRNRKKRNEMWLDSNLYPQYYLHNFHFQPDGWFSTSSAKSYEYQTETVFVGVQDAMQRGTLVPISKFMNEIPGGRDPSKMKMLDVACGTGRFLTFVKDNYPSLPVTALDLSPYYIEEAHDNLNYWADFTGNQATLRANFVQAKAEDMPLADESYDIITCIYLFHEIPAEAHRAVVKEMARIVKPGGLVVLTDSVQEGDRAITTRVRSAEWFSDNFNEPHHLNYTQTDLGKLLQDAGLECEEKGISFVSKTLSFRKPL